MAHDLSTVIVTLGKRLLDNGEPTDVLKSRVRKAVNVYFTANDAKLLMSGGNPQPDVLKVSEAEVMRALAVLEGISSMDVILEDQSQTTIENALLVREMLATIECQNIILVTSDYHMRRAKEVFIQVLNLDISSAQLDNLNQIFAGRTQLEYIAKRSATHINLETVADIPNINEDRRLAEIKFEDQAYATIKDDINSMLAGNPVPIQSREY